MKNTQLIVFQILNVLLTKSYKMQLRVLLFLVVFYIMFYISRYHFLQLYLKKIFLSKIFLCQQVLLDSPTPLIMKQNTLSLPRNSSQTTIGKQLIVLTTKVNLLYVLYLIAMRCCLLDLIKQNFMKKTFIRILIFITLVSLCFPFLLELIPNYKIFL